MVPSALRTMSVVTLLSAVSGTVFLLNDHSEGSEGTTVESTTATGFGPGGRTGAAAAVLTLQQVPSQRAGSQADRTQMQIEIAARRAGQREDLLADVARQQAKELAEKRAKQKAAAARATAKAKAKAEAATERRRELAAERASRSAARDPRAVARTMAADRGWGSGQFSCLNSLWNRESGWNHRATNPSSGAYGIPQSLPASKMAAAGADYRTNPVTQIRWGLNYIDERYGTPCGAWAHSESTGWY